MKASVNALTDMGWEGLKIDSCSQFNNLSWWNALINESSTVPVLLQVSRPARGEGGGGRGREGEGGR